MSLRVAVNGLGRIGRCILRAAAEHPYSGLEIVAVNGPAPLADHVHLLTYDSVHGRAPVSISGQGNTLHIGDLPPITVLGERDPLRLPWKELNIDIVLECTGKFTHSDTASQHLSAGAKKVLVSAPCEKADATIVYGVNHTTLRPEHKILSVGSCTTNALAPVLKVLHDTVGVMHGFMTTVHSYTNDQNILDGSHKDKRRARAAALSMVPTSTGAAKAIGLVIPELEGKLAGAAVRVPTPNVSMVDLCVVSERATSRDELNAYFETAANAALQGVLGYTNLPLVSSDFVHDPHSGILDALETKVVGEHLCRVVSWYDNEWGFSLRMLDVASLL